jgi:phosphoadenosine phosphosulfate reductase
MPAVAGQRSRLGALVDPLGIFRGSALVTNDARDKAALEAYMQAHDLPAHPLVELGYPSVGCWPCTQPVEAGQDVRAGRWAGSEKTECGIHVARAPGSVNDLGGDI